MNYLNLPLLNNEELKILKTELLKKDQIWEDGRKTAGTHAAQVKKNLQLNKDSEISRKFSNLITKKMLSIPLIKSFCLPKNIHGIMFTRSNKNMKYGSHVDNAFMSTGRADLSFTIFLSQKNEYEGGELLIQTMNSENKFKLDIGQIIIYPSTYLHSVSEVLNGERLVCVGWIESYIKSSEGREYLFDLDAGAKSLLAKHGRSNELDLIFKSYANLLRFLST
tara:strand:- start:139 stop:804 length:666 start_codon:yes stop_codon:yes gene_type:complete